MYIPGLKLLCIRTIALVLLLPGLTQAEPDITRNKLGMELVYIPAGTFNMGSTSAQREQALQEMLQQDQKPHRLDNYRDELPQHPVRISEPFLLGRTEVTQQQWLQVMQNRPGPDEYWQHDNWRELPVVSVSWNMAQRFVDELSNLDSDYDYRLPTEAEWEYAARAGSTGLRPFPASELFDRAWYFDNSGDVPHPVAQLPANAWGLHDMFGNAWEWVHDWYSPDAYGDGSLRVDPTGPTRGEVVIRRGGSYHCPGVETRSAFREANSPDTRFSVTGFRVVAFPKQ
jgi:formylglycine-generating enzyme required for sulfatase activity